jgi:hypothetical protein
MLTHVMQCDARRVNGPGRCENRVAVEDRYGTPPGWAVLELELPRRDERLSSVVNQIVDAAESAGFTTADERERTQQFARGLARMLEQERGERQRYHLCPDHAARCPGLFSGP